MRLIFDNDCKQKIRLTNHEKNYAYLLSVYMVVAYESNKRGKDQESI